ncbi:PQQ-binding-like beta-propeller repeat protein [Bremerella cremea]|uniref:outer membrane protein assembly factor BamB family protein n=1 Tax=Bremerella cremea TaxID=1031537 RepID=UPI0031EF4C3C
MNDTQLIELIQESPIEELTLEQIQTLRARLSESAPLRDALVERLQMEHHLVDVLGASGDTPDQFVQKVLARKQRQASTSRWGLGFGLALALLLVIGLAAFYPWNQGTTVPDTAQNTSVPTKPEASTEEPTDTKTKPEPSQPLTPAAPATSQEPMPNNAAATEPSAPMEVADADGSDELVALTPRDVEPISFAHLTALPDSDRRDSLNRTQFETWFTKASDKLPSNIEEFRDGDRPQLRMKGWFRLRGTLPESSVLRFQLSDTHRVRFHFYAGDTGVTIVKHQHDYSPWYAYAMHAGEDGIQPSNLLLQANDGYREHRGPARHFGPVAFYFDDSTKELVFYKGDVEVIRTPLPHSPDRIYFEGESIVRQMNLWPVGDAPQVAADYPIQYETDRPADLPWQSKLAEGTTLEKNGDGSLSMVANNPQNHSWATLPLPGHGLRMVDLKLSNLDHAASVFLAQPAKPPEEGKEAEVPQPQDGVVFSRNRRTGKRFARFSYVFDSNHEVDRNPLEHPSTEVADNVWVRLLVGGSQIRGWISLDGEHWALLSSEDNDTKGLYNQVGFSVAKVDGEHRPTVQKLVVRELPGLNHLFTPEHWKQVDQIPWKQLGDSPYPEEPFTLEDGTKVPADLATRLRRYSGTSASLDHMTDLCEEALAAAKSTSQKKQILAEMLLLTRTWPLDYHEKRFITWCTDRLDELFAQQLFTEDRQDYAAFRRELLNLPSMNRDPMGYFAQDCFNAEILAAIQQQRWDDILNDSEALRHYYSYEPAKVRRDFPIINWGGGIASRYSGRSGIAQEYLTEGRSTSMLVEDLSKEAYNISAELNAALESGAIADACRLITQIPESAAEGLAPSGSDPNHLFSVPAAIQMAVQNHQPLREQMEKENADLAQLRVNSAIQRGDRQVVELVTLQFFDTQAAAQAHLWLGDQATAAGDFATSLQHYMKAGRSAHGSLKGEIDARLLMLGHAPIDASTEPQGEVVLGSSKLSATTLVDETSMLRVSAQSDNQPTPTANKSPEAGPWIASGTLRDTPIVLRGQWGREKEKPPTSIRDRKVDWRARYLSFTLDGNFALVSNRFELWKLDLANGKEVWKQSEKDKDRGKAHDFPFTQTKPLIVGNLIVCRMLHEKGFALYGLDRNTGEQRWATNLDGQLVLATDPVSVQGRALLVTLKEVSQSTYAVRLSRVDLTTGEILDSHPLFRIRDTWFDRGVGNIVLHREQLLVDLGGVLASCDISGHLQWVRKQLTFPQKIDDRWAKQRLSDIVVVGDQAAAFHAGILRMECFDIATGHLNWTYPASDVRSIRRTLDNQLLVETPDRWVVLSMQSGEPLHEVLRPAGVLSWHLIPDGIVSLVYVEPTAKDAPASVQVIQTNLTSGEETAVQNYEVPSKEDPAAGPLFYADGKWYLWAMENREKDERKLMVLE